MKVLNIYIIAVIVSVLVIVGVAFLLIIFSPSTMNRDCAIRHNHYRHFHGSPFLSISNEVVKYAEKRAEELSTTNIFAHPQNSPFGENLYRIIYSEDKPESLDSFECETAVKKWYDEIVDYNFKTGRAKNSGKMIGHFTQLVWIDTAYIGCAKSYSSKSRALYLVCNYDPPGNWIGLNVEKVPPPQ